MLVTSPAEGRFEGRDAVLAEIASAKHEIEIQQQYIWDPEVVGALVAACHRGVSLRVMIPNPEQVGILHDVNSDNVEKLIQAGGQARWYLGLTPTAHLHTKYFSIDDRWALDGSMNADPLSTMDNQELGVATTDATLIAQWKQQLFETDWAQHSEAFVYHQPAVVWRPFFSVLDLLAYYM